MQIIHEITDIDISNLLIIAIDIEHGKSDLLRFEVGVAVLDTSKLHTVTRKKKLILTRSFCVGERLFRRDVTKKFKFGMSELIRLDELEPALKSVVSNRKFALVFHDRRLDVEFLERLQVNLKPDYLFDTSYSAKKMLGSTQSLRLADLAKHFVGLDIPQPAKFFHNAGNDANTTLRVFLMLIVLELSTTAAIDEPMLRALRQIAQQPISGLEPYSIPHFHPKPNPPKQNLEEKRKRRREKHERKALMKEWKEPLKAQKVADKLAATRKAMLTKARM
ncbi:hypothetical protein EG329_006457 [Mollisiaceae sp. DMI_Dod_QoI]|nr:hypothetical protein EG329_006457 [Helotiales sp. DMI_Dod_QoI]